MVVRNANFQPLIVREYYKLMTLPDGRRIFAKKCPPDTEGAIKMVKQKGKSAGEIYYVTGGNAISGLLRDAQVRDGYEGKGKEVVLRFDSFDEDKNQILREYVQFDLVNAYHKVNRPAANLLLKLLKADLDQEVIVNVRTEYHKKGTVMNNETGEVWKNNYVGVYFDVYQPHRASENNKYGKIWLEAHETYKQPLYYTRNRQLVPVTPDNPAPEGVVLEYLREDALEFAEGITRKIRERIGAEHNERAHAHADSSPEGSNPSSKEHNRDTLNEEDMVFGEGDHVSFGEAQASPSEEAPFRKAPRM